MNSFLIKTLILTILAFNLTGCSTPIEQQHVSIQRDPYSRIIEVDGVTAKENPFMGTSKIWKIRSFVDKAHRTVVHQTYVEIIYNGEWRFYDHTNDQYGDPLNTVSIDRQVLDCSSAGCLYDEIVEVNLPYSRLMQNINTGYSFKVYGKSYNDVVISLPPTMIRKQIESVAKVVQSK